MTKRKKAPVPDMPDGLDDQDLEAALEELKLDFEALTTFTIEENIMAKTKSTTQTPVKKISDKLVKVNESFTINMYDNGYMIEVSGRDGNDEWKNAKIMVTTVEELCALVWEATEMTRSD